MFSANLTWIPVNTNTVPAGDVNPCNVDIAGSSTFPALFVALDDTYVNFRIRLNCDPRMNNSTVLANSVWGVLIKDTTGTTLQFAVRVNENDQGLNPVQAVQVYAITDPTSTDSSTAFLDANLQCSTTIDYTATGNVEIDTADSNFDSNPDYFLDFRVPRTCFSSVEDFFTTDHVYCGFTSQNPNNINKEVPPPYTIPIQFNSALCGGETPPTTPKVSIVKTVTPLVGTTCPTEPQTYTATITITNISGQELTGLTLTDTITDFFVITVGDRTLTINNITLAATGAGSSTSFTHIVTGFFNTAGMIPFNTATVTQGTTVLGEVTGPNITVTQCRGLLFS